MKAKTQKKRKPRFFLKESEIIERKNDSEFDIQFQKLVIQCEFISSGNVSILNDVEILNAINKIKELNELIP